MPSRRKVALGLLGAGVLLVLVCGIGEWRIHDYAGPRMYSDVQTLPPNRVGLVLGTSAKGRSGGPNPYFVNRMRAAAELYRARRVQRLLVSGDNSRVGYNEPLDMQQALLALGVDSSAITMDFAGFTTFDSIVRAQRVFQQQRFTIISQRFHNERALWIARHYGINAIAFNARDTASAAKRIWLRERGVRAIMWLRHAFGKEPHFLGPTIPIN